MSIRSDQYGHLQSDSELFPNTVRIDVAPLGAAAIEMIMTETAKALEARFVSADLPGRIAAATAGQPGGMALLSVFLADMWRAMQQRDDGLLSLAATGDTIDVGAALVQRATKYYDEKPERQNDIRKLFVPHLVRVPKDGPPLRRRAEIATLSDQQRKIVEDLAASDYRLLTTSGDEGIRRVEVAHEVLFNAWQLLKGWIEGERSFLEWKDEVEKDRQNWKVRQRRGDLLMGGPLIRARGHLIEHQGDIDEPEKKYIRQSILWYRTKKATVAAILALLIGGFAVGSYVEARNSRLLASKNSELVIVTTDLVSRNKELEMAIRRAILNETLALAEFSREALAQDQPVEAMQLALAAWPRKGDTDRPQLRRTLESLSMALPQHRERRKFIGHGSSVRSAVFSPDGRRIARRLMTTRRDCGTPTAGLSWGCSRVMRMASILPTSHAMAAASSRRLMTTHGRLWDASSGAPLAVLKGHEYGVNSAVFSTDGRRVVTASVDYTARLWDANSGAQLAVLKGHEGEVRSAVFSPDGRRVVTASDDNTARLWDANSGAQLAVLKGHEDGVNSAVFSHDGRRIVTASWDKTARLWDASSGAQLAVLKGHEGGVDSADFSTHGRRIVTASSDKTARLWDSSSGVELAVLKGHEDGVNSADFSTNGRRIVTGSSDKTARLWDASSGVELAVLKGHEDGVNSAVFSTDGRRIVTASSDKTARLWDASSGVELAVLKGHEDGVNSAVFSTDGRRIVTASSDKTARL